MSDEHPFEEERIEPPAEDPRLRTKRRRPLAAKAPGESDDPSLDAVDGAEPIGQSTDRYLADYTRNDHGNSRRLIDRHGADMIHVDQVGWHVWSGKRWAREGGETAARQRAADTAVAMLDELRETGPRDGEIERTFAERINAAWRFAIESGNRGRIEAMLALAAVDLHREAAELDALPYLFNADDAALSLAAPSDQIAEHDDGVRPRAFRRADMLTRQAAAAYDPEAECPTFLKFLSEILPNPEIRTFLQRFFGFVLTGDVGEQVMLVCYGTGANGKSTLLNTIAAILGSYAVTLPIATFLHDNRRSGREATPDLARLPGMRLALAGEPEIGARLSESVVKSITGGDRIVARALYGNQFEFDPAFKLVLSCNHMPAIKGQDEGIWRRVLIVPFEVYIPPERRRRPLALKGAMLAEAPGILNWLLDGYRMWREQGLAAPNAVRKVTDEYRAESDPLGDFLAGRTEQIPGASVSSQRLYEAYERWAAGNAVEPVSKNLFGRMLTARGYRRDKAGIMFYHDLALKDEPAEARGVDGGFDNGLS